MKNTVIKFWVVLITAGLVSACAVTPDPITESQRAERAVRDLEAMFEGQDPVKGPISLSEAIARAIKYNLDHRVKLMEKAVVRAEAELAQMDLLPAITADAGYTTRSNVAASSSESILTGQQSLEPSTSQEQTRALANLNVVWNVLDFGVSYITAQQRADRILIAEEKRRKAVQNIVQDVRVAYWNALSADRLTAETDDLLKSTELALNQSEAMEASGIQTPLTSMRYQEGLLATLRTLWQLRQRLNTAKAELASLMNIRPGTDFELAPDPADQALPEINTIVPELEEFGLLHRPELIEEDYRLQIDSAEIRKAMLRMLPGIEINAGYHYDSNDFLVNNDWADAGLRISWNLFNLFRGPRDKKRAEAQVDLDEARRLATGMAVLTQINVAHQRYDNAMQDFQLSENLLDVKMDIARQEQGRFQAQVSDELTLIRTRLDTLVARMQRDLALAELQNAAGRLHNSIGLDPLPDEVKDHDLETLELAVATQQRSLQQMLARPELDPNMYDEIARQIATERALKRREEALMARQAAKERLAEVARQKAQREAAAAQAAAAAVAAQQEAINAAVQEAEAKRQAQEEAARQLAALTERQAKAEQARRAAEEAARAAAEAQAEAQTAQQRAAQAAQARQAELDRIQAEVQAQISQAVEAALVAGEAREQAQEAAKQVQDAERRVQDIIIPEVPAKENGTDQSGTSAPDGSEDTGASLHRADGWNGSTVFRRVRTEWERMVPVEQLLMARRSDPSQLPADPLSEPVAYPGEAVVERASEPVQIQQPVASLADGPATGDEINAGSAVVTALEDHGAYEPGVWRITEITVDSEIRGQAELASASPEPAPAAPSPGGSEEPAVLVESKMVEQAVAGALLDKPLRSDAAPQTGVLVESKVAERAVIGARLDRPAGPEVAVPAELLVESKVAAKAVETLGKLPAVAAGDRERVSDGWLYGPVGVEPAAPASGPSYYPHPRIMEGFDDGTYVTVPSITNDEPTSDFANLYRYNR